MSSMKFKFNNRDGVEIVGTLDLVRPPKGLAFIAHGLSGSRKEPQITEFAKACNEAGYSSIRWDAANTLGESGGDLKYANVTSYHSDLEDVIAWAKSQDWYQQPFVLMGHSLGGISVGLYAEEHPEHVKGLAPLSTVVSGKLSKQTKIMRGIDMDQWKRDGYFEEPRQTAPGTKKVYYSELEDRLRYDLLPHADKLTMPLLFIVGSEDDGTPEEHQRLLMNAATSSKKEIHVINGAKHSFIEHGHLDQVKKIIVKWVSDL
jgi:alpha-beta hydrolase superfamily lysophospholipase